MSVTTPRRVDRLSEAQEGDGSCGRGPGNRSASAEQVGARPMRPEQERGEFERRAVRLLRPRRTRARLRAFRRCVRRSLGGLDTDDKRRPVRLAGHLDLCDKGIVGMLGFLRHSRQRAVRMLAIKPLCGQRGLHTG